MVRRARYFIIAGIASLMLIVFAAATVGRPYINLSSHAGEDLAQAAYLEQKAGRTEKAIALYEHAVRVDDRQAWCWYNLGIAYQQQGRHEAAVLAYEKATMLAPGDLTFRVALEALRK